MIFTETKLKGAFIVEPERFEDERGYFARSWSADECAERGLEARIAECNISFNKARGTLRGMHYQEAPHAQVKNVRCTRGGIYDVAVDLRPESPTFRQWVGVQLTERNGLIFHIPEGFAHGFLTLEDEAEVFYQMSSVYAPASARGVRWDDPAFGIVWPRAVEVINERDAAYGDFAAA